MKQRFEALDIVRGLSVIGMIMVIVPGAWEQRFNWLDHTDWRGYNVSDLIFPTFLFCVGFSMALSLTKRMERGNMQIVTHLISRSLLLIFVGLLIALIPDFNFASLRIPGILQRIGICYLIVGLLIVYSQHRTAHKANDQIKIMIIIATVIAVLYWALLYFVPVPGYHTNGFDSQGSWPAYIDRKVFGIAHMWEFGTTNKVVTYDPEGLLSTLPACINVILGATIGFLYLNNSRYFTISRLFIVGLCLYVSGWLLDFVAVDPIIKKLWTVSFALLSTGFSIMLLALIMLLLTNKWLVRIFYPAKVFGANPLLAFIVAMSAWIIDKPFISSGDSPVSLRKYGYQSMMRFNANSQYSSFLFTLLFLVVLYIPLWLLYRKKRFIRI